MSPPRKTRVIINGPLPPPVGGMESYCRDYMKSGLACEFSLVFCRAILIKSVFTTHGVMRFVLRMLNSMAITSVWLVSLIRTRPDVAHVHTNSYSGFFVKAGLAMLAKFFGARSILHIHGGEFKEFYGGCSSIVRGLIRWLLNRSNIVIVLSREWRDFFVSIGVRGARIAIVENCVFLPSQGEGADSDEKLTVLFMSRFEHLKGVFELVKVLESRAKSIERCRFILAGPKSHEWNKVADRVARLGVGDRVSMPGAVDGAQKDAIYRSADIYVLQSHNEGMPIGLLEAMSYGLACITTGVGGIPAVVKDLSNGLIIAPGDAEGLRDAIEKLEKNPDMRKELGRRARQTIEADYCWSRRAAELATLYTQPTDPSQ